MSERRVWPTLSHWGKTGNVTGHLISTHPPASLPKSEKLISSRQWQWMRAAGETRALGCGSMNCWGNVLMWCVPGLLRACWSVLVGTFSSLITGQAVVCDPCTSETFKTLVRFQSVMWYGRACLPANWRSGCCDMCQTDDRKKLRAVGLIYSLLNVSQMCRLVF